MTKHQRLVNKLTQLGYTVGFPHHWFGSHFSIQDFVFQIDQAPHSCAIPVMCDFEGFESCPVNAMVLLLQLAQLSTGRQKYITCVTLDTKEWNGLNDALFTAGFYPTATVPTRSGGRYKNIVWEWVG